ncbi:13013_t:CDS:1 [Funneliformis mosseae]|uniref:13013_t:CDS:1 n=1 Tax=Funneliformis mosseae TaxID=27381 RepID=A0A9N9FCH0_FUNMO|nr:13013_t:CDS:1 [Funneliformis mosseae]
MSYLWARPLSTASKHYKLIRTYISCLEDVDKLLIDDQVVVLPDLPQPLFDYASYLTEFRYHRLKWAAELWIKIKDELASSSHNPKAFEITKALSNLLMRKCSKLDTFSIYCEDMPDYTIFSKSPYLSRINKFSCFFSDEYTYRYRECSRNTLDLLQFLPTVCHDIRDLDFRQCDSTQVNLAMKDIIIAIPNLQNFKYYGSKDLIYREEIILLALKSQTNNLSSLFLCRVLINDAIYEILSGCVNLETLVISDCKCSLSIISSTKTKFNLKKLHLELLYHTKLLIQKFGNDNLRSLYLNTLFKNICQTILKSCSNIVEFHCNELKSQESGNLFNLLDNLNFLEKLTLTDMVLGVDSGTDDFYDSLGTHLPPTLKYLNIGQLYKPNKVFGIDQFHHLLKNCKASLETIIINQPIEYNDSDLEHIINYTKQTNSLRFLGLNCLRNNHQQRFKELRENFDVFIIPKYDLKNW